MSHRTAAFFVIQLIVIQNVYSQVVNRVVPNCGQNIVPELMIGTPTVTPLVMERPYEVAPTIIQDSSVANSLANALQLLVVSNLLSTTLPSANCEVLAPAFAPIEMLAPNYAPVEVIGGGLLSPYGSPCNCMPSYNYIY
ncbi:hypothetical protein RR48_10119 [Papilio machaon]|uniref:Uncharacterized protein n=1 Tax=Papilio machaon TaxID=76193 RepID=A0A194R082_PAPMA|nr:hypothetical protein RR48_10119 [Papilio machaon]